MTRPNGLSDADLASIRQRAEAATAGPWIAYIEGRDHTSGSDIIKMAEGTPAEEDIELHGGATPADYDFIASAREDIPKLLNEIERLKAIVEAAD